MAIELSSVGFSYQKNGSVLNDISVKIPSNDFVAIVGPNGSGKSTLLKLLLGLLQPTKGFIKINGQKSSKNYHQIGYVPQKTQVSNDFPAKVSELLQLNDTKNIVCTELGIKKLLHRQFKTLSGGEQQKVLIEMALQNNPSIVVLDEPTAGIDFQSQKEFYALLEHLHLHHHITILLVTHDIGMIPKCTKNVLFLHDTKATYVPITKASKTAQRIFSHTYLFGGINK